MATCLIALGSNLGDREATLRTALVEMDALPLTRVVRSSRFYDFAPIGGPAGQENFLNAATLIDTQLTPLALHEQLLQIETRHGRRRNERWSARTLDLDLLLYGDQEIDAPVLIVPHAQMSFRRFVLEPAAEIAGAMIHPRIGWSIQQLLDHLNSENKWLAIVSVSDELRARICRALADRFQTVTCRPSLDRDPGDLWPDRQTAWLELIRSQDQTGAGNEFTASTRPKLTILVEAGITQRIHWGRGPTLALRTNVPAEIERELSAAIISVWPDLG